MNAVVAAVAVMLVLSLLRIHVVVALIIGALTGAHWWYVTGSHHRGLQ